MKLIAFMCVYNEGEYISYSLRSIYDQVDQIIIFEGAWGECKNACGNSRSNDGTIEQITNFPDPAGKIKLHFLNEATQLEQRSKIFEFLPEEQCWMLLIDGDEVYPEKSIKWARDFVDCKIGDQETLVNVLADVVRLRSLIFVNDFYHVCKVDYPRLFKVRGGKDKESGRTYYKFVEPNHLGVLLADGSYRKIENLPGGDDGNKSVWDCTTLEFFHYSYCHSPARFLEKKRERLRLHGQFAWELRRDPETGETLVQRDGARIEEFTGEHPPIMREHPLYGLKRHKILPQRKTFCVVSHSGIGNLVLTTPCIKALRELHPDARIVIMSWERSFRILEGWEVADFIVHHHPHEFLRASHFKPDAVLLSPAGAVWDPALDGTAHRVFRAPIGEFWGKHEAEYLMDFVYQLGYRGPMPSPEVHVFAENRQRSSKFQLENNLANGRFICVNASFLRQDHWHLKHMGDQKFAEIMEGLHKMFWDAKFVMVGTDQDQPTVNSILQKCNVPGHRIVNACGWSGDVKDTAALMSAASMVVGNDGGLMHIAAAVGVPTVTGFTFTNPVKNRPLGELSSIVMRPCERRMLCQHGGRWSECGARGCLDVPTEAFLNACKGAADRVRS